MATEKLKFKLELYATMWDKPPVGDTDQRQELFNGDNHRHRRQATVIEFEHELTEGENVN
jgi:hypothetical protein